MLNIEKTLLSVRELLGMLREEGFKFILTESVEPDCVAAIKESGNRFLPWSECLVFPDCTFRLRDFDGHLAGVYPFEEFCVYLIKQTADRCRELAEKKRGQWVSLCDGRDIPVPDSIVAIVDGLEYKAKRLDSLNFPVYGVSHGDGE